MAEEMDVRKLTRFEEGASVEGRREFGQKLLAALDELGIEPGDDFTVVDPDELDELLEPDEDDFEELRASESVTVLLAVFDFRRGMIDADEMTERILGALKDIITGDFDAKEHALMGLPHTGGLIDRLAR